MPNMNGLDMAFHIKKINPNANIIFTTAYSESKYLLEAISLQVDGYLIKPVQKVSLLVTIEKIAKRVVLEKENKQQKDILQHIIDYDSSISVVTNLTDIYFANKSFLNFFDISNISEFSDKYISIIDIFSVNNHIINKTNIENSIKRGINLYEFIHSLDEINRVTTLRDKNNHLKSFYINISKINNTNFLITFTDITQIEKIRAVTTKKAYIDGLTGVFNRNKLEEVFEEKVKESKIYHRPLSMAIVDIDHFKKFNDTYGHLIGDEVLIMLAEAINKNVRKNDFFARWGGEEFVLLFNSTSIQGAMLSADKIRMIVESLNHKTAGKITASFGVTQFRDNDTIDSIFERADKALYLAKESGRNCVKSIK
jgi:diguanylate cyclase (GGDEF)-like protein